MELTRRCDYACRILRSAYKHRDGYVSIADVAEEEDIPYAFARTIQHDLATAGYLKTVRGARGGLALSIDPKQVTILDVLKVLQGPVAIAPCSMDPDSCDKSATCSFNKVWAAADQILNTLFASLTLQSVFDDETGSSDLDAKLEENNAAVSNTVDELISGVAEARCPAAKK